MNFYGQMFIATICLFLSLTITCVTLKLLQINPKGILYIYKISEYIYIYNIVDTKVQFTKNLIGFILLGISLIVSFVVCMTIDGVLVNEEEREGWTTVVVTGIILDFIFVQTLKCVLIYAILNLQFRSAFLLMTSGYSIL